MKSNSLKRSGFKPRESPMARSSTLLAKPAKEPKRRTRKCKLPSCRDSFEPRSMTHITCGPACAETWGELEKARKLARERREGLAKLKTKSDFTKAAQRAFNAFIRERDKDKPCICCGRTSVKQYLTGSNWDCGHYRSTGSAPFHRFNEDNAHRQLVFCNRDRAGNAVEYRIGLIARIGLARVEALESDNAPRHYDIDALKAIAATYRAKLVALKKTTT